MYGCPDPGARADARTASQGPLDVLLAHDCPQGVPLALPPPAKGWARSDLARSDAHRDKVSKVSVATRPELVLHGHYHLRHSWTAPPTHPYRGMRVVGLDGDDSQGNIAVLDLETLRVS